MYSTIVKKYDFRAHTFSLIKKNTNENYIGIMRQVDNSYLDKTHLYPECFNTAYMLELDSSFNVLSKNVLNQNKECLSVPRYVNWSCGIEDSRLLDESSLLSVSLDTNPHWKPEMVYIEISDEEKKITKLTRLYIEGKEMESQKNWLFLKKEDNRNDNVHFLYFYNPFQIISVDLNTGKGHIIKTYNVPNMNLHSHGGACIYLEKRNEYLVLVRNYEVNLNKNASGHPMFANHCWLLFNDLYDLCGISEPFLFEMQDDTEIHFQICMSLILDVEGDCLYAPVTTNEKITSIYKLHLEEVLNVIRPVPQNHN